MKIGIIGAMDVEVEDLIATMDVENAAEYAGQKYYE